jgi:hypothetical protein
MDVELLVIDGCPHEGAAAMLVRRALNDVGLGGVPIRTRVVSSEAEARKLSFPGSPTVRINGEDPFPHRGERTGLACRTYIAGGIRSPVPDLSHLRQALKRHADIPGRA